MIEVRNLTKRYGRTLAVDNLSFEVSDGEIVGFLGPNGAGKSTTMRILSCFLAASGGTVKVAGHDVLLESLEVRRRVGYLPENVPLYTDMRVKEYLKFRARLKGLRGRTLRGRVDAVISDCGLDSVKRAMISRLSKGYRQRVGLADSLVHDPDLLILDEPTIGLDPHQIRHIRALIKSLSERHTVLLSSHILSEVELVCDRVLILNKGRIAASGTPAELSRMLGGSVRLTLDARVEPLEGETALRAVPGVTRVVSSVVDGWTRFECDCHEGDDLPVAIFRFIASRGWDLRELHSEHRTLEDAFVAITSEREPEETETQPGPAGDDDLEVSVSRDQHQKTSAVGMEPPAPVDRVAGSIAPVEAGEGQP